jgi:hypothetical protein
VHACVTLSVPAGYPDRRLLCGACLAAPAKGDCMASMSWGEGRPVTSRMRSSWFMVEVPGKTGLPLMSSPRMQPAHGRQWRACQNMRVAASCCQTGHVCQLICHKPSCCPLLPPLKAHRMPTCPPHTCTGVMTAGSLERGNIAWPHSLSARGCPPRCAAVPQTVPAQSLPSSLGTRC